MKVTERTKRALEWRREKRDMLRKGWEPLGEGGGQLWEIYRGCRMGKKITASMVSCDGMSVWVKIE